MVLTIAIIIIMIIINWYLTTRNSARDQQRIQVKTLSIIIIITKKWI